MDRLAPFGWGEAQRSQALRHSRLEPGRLIAVSRGLALAQTRQGECWCVPGGRLRALMEAGDLAPCVGDWALLHWPGGDSRARLEELLPRATVLARQAAGPGCRAQALAANLDQVFIAMGLDRDFNPARLERLMAIAWGSGAQPAVLLTKADRVPHAGPYVERLEALAGGVPILPLSVWSGEGLGEVEARLRPGTTSVLIGSSGVGKSTLLNALAGEELRRTREVRASDGRGRHTTSLRELFLLPSGGCLIDTPGIREVGLLAEGSDLARAFEDIEGLAKGCRFRDCAHGAEPGCAVQAALGEGHLDPARYEHFLRLRREVDYAAARADERLWREREQKWKDIAKLARSFKKGRY